VNQKAALAWKTDSNLKTNDLKCKYQAMALSSANLPLWLKAGTRSYRLRQLFISGEESFSLVRAVSSSGSATGVTSVAAYPNPFVDKIDFNLNATPIGSGVAHVQLVDMTGRPVREQNVVVQHASRSLNDLASLRSALYVAKLTLPDGTSQTVRAQMQ